MHSQMPPQCICPWKWLSTEGTCIYLLIVMRCGGLFMPLSLLYPAEVLLTARKPAHGPYFTLTHWFVLLSIFPLGAFRCWLSRGYVFIMGRSNPFRRHLRGLMETPVILISQVIYASELASNVSFLLRVCASVTSTSAGSTRCELSLLSCPDGECCMVVWHGADVKSSI